MAMENSSLSDLSVGDLPMVDGFNPFLCAQTDSVDYCLKDSIRVDIEAGLADYKWSAKPVSVDIP